MRPGSSSHCLQKGGARRSWMYQVYIRFLPMREKYGVGSSTTLLGDTSGQVIFLFGLRFANLSNTPKPNSGLVCTHGCYKDYSRQRFCFESLEAVGAGIDVPLVSPQWIPCRLVLPRRPWIFFSAVAALRKHPAPQPEVSSLTPNLPFSTLTPKRVRSRCGA